MGTELSEDFYDNSYLKNKLYSLEVSGMGCSYKDLFLEVLKHLSKDDKILELGCGSGQLAEMIIDKGFNYVQGIDFSKEAIKIAKKRCNGNFLVGDLKLYRFYIDYNCVVATEVFEHITEDIAIIQRIKAGAKAVFSVPSYDYRSHVRFFETEESVMERYSTYFDNIDIVKVDRIYVFKGIKK